MARFNNGGGGGMPGFGGGDLSKLMKQAQKMQEDAEKLQNALETMRVSAQAGGGMVEVTVNGHGHLMAVKINPAVVDPDDVEILEDLVLTAAREATAQASASQEARMKEITGGLGDLNLPPGLLG